MYSSFSRYQWCFGHFLCLQGHFGLIQVIESILVCFKHKGYFGHFLCFGGYFGHLIGFESVSVFF